MAPESQPGPSEGGSVVLDIGEGVGAAIVHAPPALAGVEMEIRSVGAPWDGRHVAIRARRLPAAVIHAALFDSLRPGAYEVRLRGADHPGSISTFEVLGGRVTEARF
jgi:hypothetical protein